MKSYRGLVLSEVRRSLFWTSSLLAYCTGFHLGSGCLVVSDERKGSSRSASIIKLSDLQTFGKFHGGKFHGLAHNLVSEAQLHCVIPSRP